MKIYKRTDWLETAPADFWKEKCPFCTKREDEPEYIRWEWKHWYIMNNKYPILGLDTHFMAIPKRHIKLAHDISPEEMSEYPKVEKVIYDFFEGKKYFTFMRESLESRSLEHIHYHFVPGWIPYDDIEIMLKKQGF